MRHRNKTKILGRKKAPRESMLNNMVSSIIIHEKISTTKAKAKAVKPLVEKAIATAKKGDLSSRRALLESLKPEIVDKLMHDLADRYKDRTGGYLRVVKTGVRQGDGAEMAQVELL